MRDYIKNKPFYVFFALISLLMAKAQQVIASQVGLGVIQNMANEYLVLN